MTGTVDGLITGETSFGALGQGLSRRIGGPGSFLFRGALFVNASFLCWLVTSFARWSLGGVPERVKRQSRRAWLGVASNNEGSWFLLAFEVASTNSGWSVE